MAESSSSHSQEWLKFQQEYWNTCLGLNIDSKDHSSWSEAVESWWQTLIPSLSSENYETIKKFIEQSKHYLLFGEEFTKIYQELSNTEVSEWQHVWETHFKENFLNLLIHKGRLTFLEPPLEQWQQTLASFSSLSCDLLKLFDKNNLNRKENYPWLTWMNHYLHRWHEQMQERIHLWTNYQAAQEAYLGLLVKMSGDAVNLFSNHLLNLQERKINHLRALYDLWIECSEEAYLKVVHGKEYGEVQARLINSLVALKHSEREWMDEFLCTLNIPTRKEMDTLNAYSQQMKREIHLLRQQNEATVNELRQEVKNLHLQLENCQKKATTPRKKTSKKPTSE